MRSLPLLSICSLMMGLTAGCGSGGGGTLTISPPPSTISSVNVSSPNANILVKATQQFTAAVQGSGNFNPAVIWYVNNVQGGNSTVGTISASGLYTAPNSVPTPNSVTVMAQSVQDTTKSGTFSITINPENVQISVSPPSVSLQLNGTQKFSVNVTGTVNQSFTWTINGQPTTAATPWGTIDSSNLYTAPSLLPANPLVTVTATSLEDPTKSASSVVTILANAGGITVTITPPNPQVVFDGSQSIQFMANVAGTTNTAVTWSVDDLGGTVPGNITSSGLYTPSGIDCNNVVLFGAIHATSVANPAAQAVTTISFVSPTPTIATISPQPASAESQVQITGTFVPSAAMTLLFSGPNAITLPVPASLVSATSMAGIVPLGTTSGPLLIKQVCGSVDTGLQYPPTLSNAVNFQRLPHLRIRADKKDLSAAESVQVHAVLMGDSTPQPVTWENGISSSGVYTAPSQVSPDTFVTLSACIENSSACDTLAVRLNPVAIDPVAPVVSTGGNLQLSATSGGATVSPSWTILAGGGSLLANGDYTAPTALQDSGGVPVVASYGGFTANASIGVTGAIPGLVNRIYDYSDNSATPPPSATLTSSLAVDNTHAYVLSVDTPPSLAVSKYCWIDVYDITDPVHPTWIDATEALNSEPSSFACSGVLYTYGGFLYEVLSGEIAAFAFQNNHLTLQNLWPIPAIASYSFNQGVFYVLPNVPFPNGYNGPISVMIFDLRTGTLVQSTLNLPAPEPGTIAEVFTPIGAGNSLYLLINETPPPANGTLQIAVYDLSVNPPTLQGTVDAFVDDPNPQTGGTLKIFGSNLYDGWDVFDISGAIPVRSGALPFYIQDMNVSRNLAVSGGFTPVVIDVSSLATAKVTGLLDDGGGSGLPVWVGDQVYQTEGGAGLAVFSAVPPGGQLPLGPLQSKGVFGAIFDQFVSGNLLYTAQQGDFSGVVIYDLSSSPPALVGSFSETEQDPFALSLVGNSLFVGTVQGLLVLDVSTPSAPSQVAQLTLPTSALAVSGNFLYVATTDQRLVVLNISNPAAPTQVTQLSLPDFPVNLRVAGNLLFLADNTAGLLTFGISNPASPTLLSQYQPSSAVEDAAIDGNLVLLAAADGGLVIANMSNPAAPLLVSQVPLDALSCFTACYDPGAVSVAINGGLAYVGSTNTVYTEVFGFDYRTPAHPRMVSLASYGSAVDQSVLNFAFYNAEMFVGGNLFAVADQEADVSQPRNVINLYYPGYPGGSGSLSPSAVRKSTVRFLPKKKASIRKGTSH
jgi:hypothetical protein